MTTFNSITGQGVRALSSDVGSAGAPDPETGPAGPTDGVDAPLGPGTPQSIEIIENVPPAQPWAVPINTGGTVPVGGGGPSGPPPELPVPVAGPKPPPSRPKEWPPIVSGL